MNTLPRAATARFFPDPSKYHALRARWSTLVSSGDRCELTAAHHLLYLTLLGKDWRRAFTPITNSRKLANGAFYGWALFRALARLHSGLHDEELLAPFGDAVTPEMLSMVCGYLPTFRLYSLRPEEFARDSFPFDAYVLPAASPQEQGVANG